MMIERLEQTFETRARVKSTQSLLSHRNLGCARRNNTITIVHYSNPIGDIDNRVLRRNWKARSC
jgi:hypothetical protein